MEELLLKIGNYSKEEIDALKNVAKKMALPKSTVFFRGESVFNRLYFLESGIVRSYRLIDGEDFTYFFFFQNEFVVDFESFLKDEKSPFFFETLEDSTVFCFEKKDIYMLYDLYPKFEKIGRIMAENAYLSAASRLKQYQTDSLKSRYLRLMEKNPSLLQKIPQHYVASYLGVKPQSLSRIKAEISGKKY
ncbi:Crp/Fnr family transcriptional regulator [Pararhodonellum marinum]|uniref:Crp/Fnr family transcriptional regulator n=1 Tax=Pararhodonellum marinum TaxID=2755358 RepID=UPI00188F7855|nr:Crp/Fnr family transcriptional regulator [Pararhodonellum marinum]